VLAFTASSAHAANIYVTPHPSGGSYHCVTGDIDLGDEQTFAGLHPQYPAFVRPISQTAYAGMTEAIGLIALRRFDPPIEGLMP